MSIIKELLNCHCTDKMKRILIDRMQSFQVQNKSYENQQRIYEYINIFNIVDAASSNLIKCKMALNSYDGNNHLSIIKYYK